MLANAKKGLQIIFILIKRRLTLNTDLLDIKLNGS